MRAGVGVLIALFIGAIAAQWFVEDRGYVLIDFAGYIVEMSVPALVAVLVAAYLAIRVVVGLWHAPHRLGGALAERRQRRAGNKLNKGLMHLADGNWAKGERMLTQAARASDAPLVNYLMAAHAAQRQGSRERRDEWLRIAYEELPDAQHAVLLTQAELQAEAGEHERSLATACRVLESQPAHPLALALAARAAFALGDRKQLAGLVPRLGRARLEPAQLEEIAVAGLGDVLEDPELTVDGLERRFKELPPPIRRLPKVVALRAFALARLGRGNDAERELRGSLKRRWEKPVVLAYGEVLADDRAAQLRHAEGWLERHPDDAALLLTAARLCIANELWGKARSYLESSIAIDPSPEAYALYGSLLDRLGENERAALAFRSGLALVDHSATARPALAALTRGSD